MIVCSCRGISTKDYRTEEELIARLLQDDFRCGLCQLSYLNDKPKDVVSFECINKRSNSEHPKDNK